MTALDTIRTALEYMAHYDDSPDNMDDPCVADGHILADKAREALAELPKLKAEMDEAAEHITWYLGEIPLQPEPHNWLIRNGYKDTSYQECIYGQEIYTEEGGAK